MNNNISEMIKFRPDGKVDYVYLIEAIAEIISGRDIAGGLLGKTCDSCKHKKLRKYSVDKACINRACSKNCQTWRLVQQKGLCDCVMHRIKTMPTLASVKKPQLGFNSVEWSRIARDFVRSIQGRA